MILFNRLSSTVDSTIFEGKHIWNTITEKVDIKIHMTAQKSRLSQKQKQVLQSVFYSWSEEPLKDIRI